jgi:predicted MFS family arabinose efflux permease
MLFAVSAACAVANMYYIQPLLPTISHALQASEGSTSAAFTVSQLGYVVGLVFLVPLGDILRHKQLVPGLMLGCAAALAGVAAAPSLLWLLVALALAGLTSVSAQVMLPLAATLASDAERPRVVATMMSGMLVGLLLARTVAGLLSEFVGWRGVYVFAAMLMLLLAAVLRTRLPLVEQHERIGYGRLLASMGTLVVRHPALRRLIAYGSLTFAALTSFWTPMAFLLAGPRYGYDNAAIGLFGLVGLSGAAFTQLAARLIESGRRVAQRSLVTGICVVIGSWVLLAAGGTWLAALVIGLVLLDGGVVVVQNVCTAAVYALDPRARSRLGSVFFGCRLFGGAIGSAVAGVAWTRAGWLGVSSCGAAFGVVALVVWVWPSDQTRAGDALTQEYEQAHPAWTEMAT